MKKSSVIILSLVAVLTACNKNTGPNDWFAQKRKENNLTNQQRQELINQYDYYGLTMKYVATVRQEHSVPVVPSNWMVDSTNTTTTFTRTLCNFNKTGASSVGFYSQIGETINESNWTTNYMVGFNGGKYEFTKAPGPLFNQDPKDLYFKLYDSVFTWGMTLLSGAHLYLSAAKVEDYCPQGLLDKATLFEVFIRTGTSLLGHEDYKTNGNFVQYDIDDKTYVLNDWAVSYVYNRLQSYSIDYTAIVYSNNNKNRTVTNIVISTNAIVYNNL